MRQGRLAGAALALLLACGCSQRPAALQQARSLDPLPPAAEQLQAELQRQLAARGVDPLRAAALAPSAGSEVIDLEPALIDPDGSGPLPPTGYLLRWTERLTGDHDQNGEVNIADLQPIANAWQQTVLYDDPLAHDGFVSYPVGNPEFDGDAGAGAPPVIGSGAYNWRMARVDSDGNGEVNLGEITSLAKHFMEQLSGYRIYRRKAGATAFTRLDDPAQPGTPLLVPRSSVNGGAGIDPLRPVRYSYVDSFAVDAEYEYRVLPYTAATDQEGPPSLPGFGSTSNLVARLSATPTQGAAPLQVNFDASASTVQLGSITGYYWDFDGDGSYEVQTGTVPIASHTFLTAGARRVGLGVSASGGETDTTEIQISVTLPPNAVLTAPTTLREVPLELTLSAGSSTDTDGEVVRYAWDMDGDGAYELDTGPIGQRVLLYEQPGSRTVGVRVTDNLGATDTAQLSFTLTDDYDEIENNDAPLAATFLGSLAPGSAVSGLRCGLGLGSYDGDPEDWFALDVPSGVALHTALGFANADANIDLQLFDRDGAALLGAVATLADGETLDLRVLRSGRYYLRAYRAFGPGGNGALYQLGVAASALTYDEVEPNGSPAAAQDLGNIDLNLVPGLWGRLGSPAADTGDWYRFSVGFASNFRFKLRFFHDESDLELQVLAADGQTLIGASSSVNDDEETTVHLEPGAYLVRCFQFGGGSANYELSILVP